MLKKFFIKLRQSQTI